MALVMDYTTRQDDLITSGYYVIVDHRVVGSGAHCTLGVYKKRSAYKNGKPCYETFDPLRRNMGRLDASGNPFAYEFTIDYSNGAPTEKAQIYQQIKQLPDFSSAVDSAE